MKDYVLLVDDESNVLTALTRALSEEPYEVHSVKSGEEGLQHLLLHNFKVVISDERMPGMDGAEFLAAVKENYPSTVRMMLTGHASVEATMRAVNRGEIYRFFTKPWNDYELKLAIRSAIEKFNLEDENRRLLRTVRRQSQELKSLENQYPGITTLQKDEQGSIVLDISDEELAQIVERCNLELH